MVINSCYNLHRAIKLPILILLHQIFLVWT